MPSVTCTSEPPLSPTSIMTSTTIKNKPLSFADMMKQSATSSPSTTPSSTSKNEESKKLNVAPLSNSNIKVDASVKSTEPTVPLPFSTGTDKKIFCLVADTAALIKGTRLDLQAEKIYTCRDVIDEVRDKRARDMLKMLPYDLIFKEPSSEAVKAVREFARKTGDLLGLSSVDIKVMALAYTLEDDLNPSIEHIRTEPINTSTKPIIKGGRALHTENPTAPGIANLSHGKAKKTKDRNYPEPQEREFEVKRQIMPFDVKTFLNTKSKEDYFEKKNIIESPTGEEDSDNFENTNENENENSDFDSDEDGWITPENIHLHMKNDFDTFGNTPAEQNDVKVACLTTDFAMQNVLIQMNMNVVSIDGMLIKRAKTFVFECYACDKITKDMTKQFCPNCGNATLRKIAASTDENGTTLYYTNRHKKVSMRGKKYSIPAYKGGRNAKNLIVRADQKEYIRATKQAEIRAKKEMKMNSDDICSTIPFVNRSSHKPVVGHGRKNPNEVKRTGNRKKKSSKLN